MTRGNQRDLARAKAAKKDVGKQKASAEQEANKGLNLTERKQRDADRMRAKQALKQAAKEGAGEGSSKKS